MLFYQRGSYVMKINLVINGIAFMNKITDSLLCNVMFQYNITKSPIPENIWLNDRSEIRLYPTGPEDINILQLIDINYIIII